MSACTRARQRGTGSNGVVLLILGILALIAIAMLGRAGAIGGVAVYVACATVIGALGWLAWASGSLPFVDSAQRSAVANRIARNLGATLTHEDQPIWGGKTATAYLVDWQGPGGRYKLQLDVTGVHFSGTAAGCNPASATVSVREGTFRVDGEASALAERLLDEPTRNALNSIDRLKGGKGDLSLHLGGGAISIYKQQALSVRKTTTLVALGTTVIDKALALMKERG